MILLYFFLINFIDPTGKYREGPCFLQDLMRLKGIAKVQPDTLTLNFSIQKKQIQTSNYSVYQNYYRNSQTSKRTPDGYNASQSITVILNGENFVELGQKVLSAAPTVLFNFL